MPTNTTIDEPSSNTKLSSPYTATDISLEEQMIKGHVSSHQKKHDKNTPTNAKLTRHQEKKKKDHGKQK
jgi:hypothetical protein